MTLGRLGASLAFALLFLALLPDPAHAWTPGTHIFLGESVLANLAQLPLAVADLLRAFPYDYLYGNIAADTSIAKKYVPVGRHCHSWNVAHEIHDTADTDPLRAFGLGYISHLAADTIAHNFYVPRQLVVTSRTIALGHSYWESRFEGHLGEDYARTAMDIVRRDHASSDAHLDRILAPTIFSVRTSRRLFRGMVGVTETQSWQRAFQILAETSRWDLGDDVIERHMAVSFQLIMEVLSQTDSLAKRLDPAGESSLQLAKRMRVDVMRNRLPGDHPTLSRFANEHFGLPKYELGFWATSESTRPWREPNGRKIAKKKARKSPKKIGKRKSTS
ncbi:MAG: zinc dependent phospholipase C family protein [Gemmatimonadota bacterium]|nr:MAG: zinc dependent phospholipase C family protein [Gemmatimonadota bacterium]